MAFTCQRCGECCSSMGEIIWIGKQTGPFEFRIRYMTTGEERTVIIDHDKRDLYAGQDILTLRPSACPFLRIRSPKEVICTVHQSRPDLCRQYSCFRILFLDPQGRRAGRVIDASRYLVTTDAGLRRLWDDEISGAEIPDEKNWEEHVEKIMTRAGYRVVR